MYLHVVCYVCFFLLTATAHQPPNPNESKADANASEVYNRHASTIPTNIRTLIPATVRWCSGVSRAKRSKLREGKDWMHGVTNGV